MGAGMALGLAVVLCTGGPAMSQDAAEPGGAWMRFDPVEEYHGLSYSGGLESESRARYIEMEGRWCLATEQEAGQFYIDFQTEPDFVIEDLDIISVTIEYLDNGTGPITLQYWSEDRVSTPFGWHYIAPPEIWRRNTMQWKRHTWQIRDPGPGFDRVGPGRLNFRLLNEGWVPDRDIFVTFIGVDCSCLWLEPEPAVLAADGEGVSKISVTARGPAGRPLPDGTEVAVHTTQGTAPRKLTLANGRAEFDFAAGERLGTAHITAVCGERTGGCQVFVLEGTGPAEPQNLRFGPAEIVEAIERVTGPAVRSSSVEVVELLGGDSFVEVRIELDPQADPLMATIPCALTIDGLPTRFKLDLGSDGSASWFTTLLQDARGERLVYTFWPMDQGAIKDWHQLELAADGRAYGSEIPGDGIIDLPAKFPIFRVWFERGHEVGVFRLRAVEADVIRPQQ